MFSDLGLSTSNNSKILLWINLNIFIYLKNYHLIYLLIQGVPWQIEDLYMKEIVIINEYK